jgi:hypothetical protein
MYYTPPFPTNSIRDTASFYPMVVGVLIERVHFGDLPSGILLLSYPYDRLVAIVVCIRAGDKEQYMYTLKSCKTRSLDATCGQQP